MHDAREKVGQSKYRSSTKAKKIRRKEVTVEMDDAIGFILSNEDVARRMKHVTMEARRGVASDQYISKLLDQTNAAILDTIKKGNSSIIRNFCAGADGGLSKEDHKEDKQHTGASSTSPVDQCRAGLSDPRPQHQSPSHFQGARLQWSQILNDITMLKAIPFEVICVRYHQYRSVSNVTIESLRRDQSLQLFFQTTIHSPVHCTEANINNVALQIIKRPILQLIN